MSDSSVNNFLGDTNNDVDRSSDSSVNRFMKSTKDYDGYEPPAQPEAQGPSVLDKLKETIAGIVDGIGEHYENNARQAFDGMKDENGNVTPESAKQAEGNGDSNNSFGNTNYESADNPIASAAYDPGYDIQARQDDGSFGGNFRRDVNAWGSTVAGDVSNVYNSGGTEGKWKLYEDAIADPAMKFAATPFIPAPARAAAGLVAAPDFISGVVNAGKKGYGDGDGSVIGGMAGVVNSLVTQPLEQLAQAALHPIDTAQSIQEHPGNLWNNVLEPGMVAEMGIRGGKKVYDNRGAIGDFALDAKNQGIGNAVFDRTAGKSFDDMGNNYSQPTDSAADSQPAPQPQTFSTGVDANVDSMVSNAAAKYQVDPALLAKLVDQESTYGRDPNAGGNLAQISNDLAQQYGLDSSDPAQSIEGGARYLKSLIDTNGGDVRAALAAYNGGPGNPQFGYADQVLGRDIGGEMGKTYSGGDNSGAATGQGAYEAGTGAWMGATMPSGPKGCVEAATRVGSFYDGFLKDEADKGVASVPTLIADAGDRFIPFDEKSLEKGDVIVYDGDEHVVTYDGNGGYVGNSTGQGRIVHGSDYHEMGGMNPTGIIKASDRSGGGGYKPDITSDTNGYDPATVNEDVDVLGNKMGESSVNEQMQADINKIVNGQDVTKPVEDMNRPAGINWSNDEPVTLYRGEQGLLDNGRHLSREQNIFDVIGKKDPNTKEDSSAPVTYYTESPEDAKAYASTDQAILKSLREQQGRGGFDSQGNWIPHTDDYYAELFNTVYGHSPRPEGKVNSYNVRLGKTLDMSDLGDTPSYNDMEKKILDTAGLKPTTNADTVHPDWDLIDNRLKLSDMYGDEDNVPAYMILKNNPRESINRANEFIKFAQEHGYNSIKYKEDGVNHYAVIERPADSLPELTPERRQDIKNIDRAIVNTADTFERNKLEGMKQKILQNPSISNKDAMAKSIQDIQYSRAPEKGAEYSRPEEADFQKVAAAGDYAHAAELAKIAGETEWSKAYQMLANVSEEAKRQPAPRLGNAKPTGKYTGDTVTKAQILKRAQELFVPIRTGRIGIRDVNGLANHASGVIRERSWGDLPTMAHEMGHMVDAALSLRGDAGRFDSEFSKVVNRRFGEGAYEPGEIRGEGIAEFMKDYMKSDAEAQKNFPQYYTAFKNKIAENPNIEARVDEIKSMYQKWEDQSPEARGRSAVTYAKDSKPTPMERIKNGWNSFVEGVVDDKDSLQRATESYEKLIGKKLETKDDPYKMGRLAQNAATARAQMLVEGKTPEQVKTSLNKVYGNIIENGITLKETLSTLDKQVKGKYGDYLQKGNFDNWHEALDSLLVARRQAEIQSHYPGYTGPMSRSDASYIMSHAPAELTAAAKKIYTYNDNIMRILRETGMIKSEVYDALADKYRNYVPMARDFSDEAGLVKGFGIGTGYANVRAALKSLSEEGSSRSVQSPLESIVKNTYTLLNLAERNRVGQTFARMAQGDRVGRLVEEVKGSAAQKDSTFSVWENGQKHVYQTTPEIYRAIMSVNKESGNIITKLLSPPAGLLRAGATLMPDFALKNIMRDSFGAAVFSRYGFRPVIDHIAGVFHMVKHDQLFQDYKASGALMSTMVGLDRDFVQASLKGLYKKDATYYWKNYNPVQILRGFSEILETATRLGEYNRAIKKGASMEDAALSARDISLDFSKAGSAGRQINKVSAFFNAGVQEPARIFEAFKEAPAKTAAKTALYITLPSIALWTINHNQEWYQETPDWEKNIFWMFKAGGTIYRIPKPFGLGVLFGSLPERSLDWMYGKDPQSIKKWADSAKDAFLPNLMPTAIVPIMEWMTNYSFFRNRSIVPGRLQKLPDAQQFGPNTSELAKDIGKMFNLSPMKLDNLIRGYGAGMATQTLNAADALTGNRDMKNPFTAAFTADPMQSPQSIQDFYDKLNDTEKAYNGAGGKTGAKGNVKYNYQLMQHANKVMQDLNKKERAAVGTRNQSAIDDINNKQLKAARDALKMVR